MVIQPQNWTIHPEHTLVIIFTYPKGMLSEEAARWVFHRFPPSSIVSYNKRGLEPARNLAVKSFLSSPEKYTDVIFMDNDVRPKDEADFFLTLDTDLASCMCETRSMQSWANPRAFHLPLCRIRRPVLEKLAETTPVFQTPLRADGLGYESCECVNFLRKALDAGFTSSHAGWAEHDSEGTHGH